MQELAKSDKTDCQLEKPTAHIQIIPTIEDNLLLQGPFGVGEGEGGRVEWRTQVLGSQPPPPSAVVPTPILSPHLCTLIWPTRTPLDGQGSHD